MTVRTKTSLAADLSTGGSNNNNVETRWLVDLLDTVETAADADTSEAALDARLDAIETVNTASGIVKLPAFTVATLPAQNVGRIIYVSDGTGNKRLAISDGTNWRFPDGNVVS